jgi:hypothetical protein
MGGPQVEASITENMGSRTVTNNAPNASQMSYSEYQKLQQMKIEMNGGASLPKHIPMDMNPLIPTPQPLDKRATNANPMPEQGAQPHN